MKAIIADDEIINRLILKHFLLEFDFEFHFAENGLEALELLKVEKNIPAILFLDISMPYLNGYEVLKTLKMHPTEYTSQLSIIVVSGLIESEFSKNSQKETYDYYIEKPVNSELLISYVNKCIATLTSSHISKVPK